MGNLLELARFYKVYAYLKIEQRDIEALAADLIELDSVYRKLSVNARVIITNISVQDDLLQIVLNRRLGKEVSLKACAYGDEYIVDIENKKILSPGPDGKTDTKDDITLPINPELLGW